MFQSASEIGTPSDSWWLFGAVIFTDVWLVTQRDPVDGKREATISWEWS